MPSPRPRDEKPRSVWYEDPDDVAQSVRPFVETMLFGRCPHQTPDPDLGVALARDCHVCLKGMLLHTLEVLNSSAIAVERAAADFAVGKRDLKYSR